MHGVHRLGGGYFPNYLGRHLCWTTAGAIGPGNEASTTTGSYCNKYVHFPHEIYL